MQLNRSLLSHLQSLLSSLGEVLCCDEKRFRFTGRGGIVCERCHRSPLGSECGITNAVGMLPTFLAFTRTHNTARNMGETTQTAGIVEEWANMILRLRQDTTLCMDSYYLCKARETARKLCSLL